MTMRDDWPKLAEIVDAFSGVRVVVAGDLVLDRFWYGAVQRISREAPVPIVRIASTRLLPGCAANTVSNLAALGGTVLPVGVVGEDDSGRQIQRLFADRGLDCRGIVSERNWETPSKTRILAGTLHGPRQQLVRVDSGEENALAGDLVHRVKARLENALEGADALILSDYGCGLVQAVGVDDYIPKVRISAIDSRFALTEFKGLTTATPNEEEFELACGKSLDEDETLLDREGPAMRERLGLKALLVTRGRKGMSLFEKDKAPVHLPVVGEDQVVDVTGAGDTVISAYVLALAAGARFPEAASIANAAGGIVVQKHSTATTDREELMRTLRDWGEGRL